MDVLLVIVLALSLFHSVILYIVGIKIDLLIEKVHKVEHDEELYQELLRELCERRVRGEL